MGFFTSFCCCPQTENVILGLKEILHLYKFYLQQVCDFHHHSTVLKHGEEVGHVVIEALGF